MDLTPEMIFRKLTTDAAIALGELPREHGIYALHDHNGSIRYIGITRSDRSGLWGRIHGRHVCGSESRSHKFSHAYNTGRMWRAKEDRSSDAVLAKRLRTAFIRRNCRATFVSVPRALHDQLPRLELQVQALAPSGMLGWSAKRGFLPQREPTSLVDATLDDLGFSADQRTAIERQAALFASLGLSTWS